MTVKRVTDCSEYDGMTDDELIPPNFSDLPKEERTRRMIVMNWREHERYVERWERMTDEERRKERMDHFRN